jgi:TorA maturation chaperone TorD
MITEAACAAARGQLYGFLAGAFLRPPTAQSVSPILDDAVLRQLAEQFGAEAVEELEQFRSRFDGSWDALDQEYQDLFTVPLGRYVTPYEAVYRDERLVDGEVVRGLLMGPSTLAVKAIYRDAGVEVADDVRELPDHIGLELGCMQVLCDAEARAREEGDGDAVARAQALQRRLLQEHLRQWTPRLCERIRVNAPGPFYRGIVALTEAFLDQEAGTRDASCE